MFMGNIMINHDYKKYCREKNRLWTKDQPMGIPSWGRPSVSEDIAKPSGQQLSVMFQGGVP